MRELSRRLAALETRSHASGFRRVVIVGPDDQSPPDSDDVHIIRIVGVDPQDKAIWALPHNGRDALAELTA